MRRAGRAWHAGRRAGPALRGLSRFAGPRGIPARREFLLDYDVIEAFCVAGLAGRASSTRGTYRSVLYRLAAPVHGPPGQRATPFAGAQAPAPYSPGERAELAAVAAAQRGAAKRASALAMVVFGIGAGLRPGELAALRGSDVTAAAAGWRSRSAGRPRAVPVAARYAGRAAGLARRAGRGTCSGPARRTAATRTSSTTSPAAWPPTRPRRGCRGPVPGHLHLRPPRRGHPGPGALLAITGIAEAGSLARYARHVPASPVEGRAAGALARGEHDGERRRPGPACRGGRRQRADRGVRRRADRPQRQGPGHRGRAGPPHRAAPPAAGARGAHRAVVPGPG